MAVNDDLRGALEMWEQMFYGGVGQAAIAWAVWAKVFARLFNK